MRRIAISLALALAPAVQCSTIWFILFFKIKSLSGRIQREEGEGLCPSLPFISISSTSSSSAGGYIIMEYELTYEILKHIALINIAATLFIITSIIWLIKQIILFIKGLIKYSDKLFKIYIDQLSLPSTSSSISSTSSSSEH